ncbi:ABC transporter ATP-binding protein [Limobrevibacterium gyesilva]|uniref:ABC transporter ATP-binding protein n=1 Tax=Limobrevibacterium gyesilva TaxID=2991712 RepID=A0AA41YVI8_9PROT|nr:ABC transporter ATP-binding protein [Limobrevibacterium gyesilva]MCW3477293.1 ABC transporter ATP-binding protein [Limobrevibacterium gyesilva]
MSGAEPVLEMRDVGVELAPLGGAARRITSDVDLALHAGRTLALVGESGCGKSVTALAAMNLLAPPLRLGTGHILLRTPGAAPRDLTRLSPAELRAARGGQLGMIFQDPMTALDPAFQVGEQIAESLRAHLGLSRRAAHDRAVELLQLVGIHEPERRVRAYPFQLSGGMRQRVMIAIAVACSPAVLIADEPTTALDVTVQAQILELLRELGARLGMATLLITHDLGVVAENADTVAVMYRGRIVERASAEALFTAPAHPYTRGLLASLPPLDGPRERLRPIPGQVPPAGVADADCPFVARCPEAMPRCLAARPALTAIAPEHEAACFLHATVAA